MKRALIVIAIISLLACVLMASAAPVKQAHSTWWPGERPTPKAAGSLAGKITNIGNGLLTLQTERNGAPIFNVSNDTRVTGAKTRLADLAVGDEVIVAYATQRDGNVWTRIINVRKNNTTPPSENHTVFGKVAFIDPTVIKINTEKDGQLAFGITQNTIVKILALPGTVSQIAVGNPALIAVTETSGGAVAHTIRILAEGVYPHFSGTIKGTIASIDSSSITIATKKSGNQSAEITPETRYMIYDQRSSIDHFKAGMEVNVGFKVLDNGNRVATSVMVPIPSYNGKISSVNSDGFVLATQSGDLNIVVNDQTKISTHTYDGTLADLRVGYSVILRGIPNGSTVTALMLSFTPPETKGFVVSVSGSSFAVKTANQKTITVAISPATVIYVRPRTVPNYKGTAADIKPGVAVNAGGPMTGANDMQALWIDLLVP